MTQDIRLQRIIFAALLIAVAMYSAIAFIMGRQNAGKPLAEEFRNPLVVPIYIVAAITFVVAIVLRARFRERQLPMRMTNIVFWSLLEAITIYGLVLSFVCKDWRLIVGPAFLTALGFILTFPQEQTV